MGHGIPQYTTELGTSNEGLKGLRPCKINVLFMAILRDNEHKKYS